MMKVKVVVTAKSNWRVKMLKVTQFTCKSCGTETDRKSNNDSRHCIDRCIPCYESWHKEEVKRRNAAKKSQMKDRMAAQKAERKAKLEQETESLLSGSKTEEQVYMTSNASRTKAEIKKSLDDIMNKRELKQIDKEFL